MKAALKVPSANNLLKVFGNLKATKRENLSSGSNNKLRAEGFIPAILYGGNNPNLNISINKKEIAKIINSETFLSKVLEIEVDGKKEKVIPRDVSFHVVSEEPIHIDFMRIVSGKKIILEIPVKFINHPNLQRILMPEDWVGHPLLKNYGMEKANLPYRPTREDYESWKEEL